MSLTKERILFIGSFLSKSQGTTGVSEQVNNGLKSSDKFNLILVSRIHNKVLRLLDITRCILWGTYNLAHIDVFSDKAFIISRFSTFLLLLRGKKIVMTLHGGKLPEFYHKNKLVFANTLKKGSYLQTPSMFLMQFFKKEGFNIHYLPNPLNLLAFPFNRDSITPYSLLWVRAFDEIYNPWLAIETLAEVLMVYPKATLAMVGPDKGELRNMKLLARKLKIIDKIKFIGHVPNEQLYTYYQSHAVYLNTTKYESFGVAVCEAASCGIPIVSTNVGEIPFIWEHEKNILLVDNFSAKEMGEMVIELMSNEKRSLQLSINGKNNIDKFSMDKILPQWLSLFKSMTATNYKV